MGVEFKELMINDDEFKLLSEMIVDIEGLQNNSKDLEYDISGITGKDAFLFQLGLADNFELTANYGNHKLVFPAQLTMGYFADFKINFKSPKIFEIGGRLRAWRLSANKKMSLVNGKGEPLDYQVNDLSITGISLSIDSDKEVNFPEELSNTYIQLPTGERIAISGFQTRKVDNNVVAYYFSKTMNDTALDSLAEYLLECHAEKHPLAHSINLRNSYR